MSTTRERYLEWKTRSLLPQLPNELWTHIFSYLTIDDLFSIRLVSRLFYSCVNQHTSFWSLVIFNIDQCSNFLISSNLLRNISSSNINLLTKSNLYSHCNIYLKAQPLKNSFNKRRKRRLLISNQDNNKQQQQSYLRCLSVHFESLRTYDQFQLEYLLKKRIRRLEFSYECLSNEPSLNFLFKLERLKYLKISFVHNISELDTFTVMLINTIQEIVSSLLRIKRLKTLILHNLYLIQSFPQNIFSIEHLRSIWFENCTNIHFLLSTIDKQHLKNVILRRSTCDRMILINFFNQLDTLHYLDLSSLQTIKSSNQTNEQLQIPLKLKTCSLNNTLLSFCYFSSHLNLYSLELIDVNIDLLSTILNTCSSLKILCLFFSTQNPSLSTIVNKLQYDRYSKLLIHLHLISINNENQQLFPSNILIIPLKNCLSCFCYQNLM